MRVYHYFFLVPESRSTFPDADPDPAKWYGSDRIRIRNTEEKVCILKRRGKNKVSCSSKKLWLSIFLHKKFSVDRAGSLYSFNV